MNIAIIVSFTLIVIYLAKLANKEGISKKKRRLYLAISIILLSIALTYVIFFMAIPSYEYYHQ